MKNLNKILSASFLFFITWSSSLFASSGEMVRIEFTNGGDLVYEVTHLKIPIFFAKGGKITGIGMPMGHEEELPSKTITISTITLKRAENLGANLSQRNKIIFEIGSSFETTPDCNNADPMYIHLNDEKQIALGMIADKIKEGLDSANDWLKSEGVTEFKLTAND